MLVKELKDENIQLSKIAEIFKEKIKTLKIQV